MKNLIITSLTALQIRSIVEQVLQERQQVRNKRLGSKQLCEQLVSSRRVKQNKKGLTKINGLRLGLLFNNCEYYEEIYCQITAKIKQKIVSNRRQNYKVRQCTAKLLELLDLLPPDHLSPSKVEASFKSTNRIQQAYTHLLRFSNNSQVQNIEAFLDSVHMKQKFQACLGLQSQQPKSTLTTIYSGLNHKNSGLGCSQEEPQLPSKSQIKNKQEKRLGAEYRQCCELALSYLAVELERASRQGNTGRARELTGHRRYKSQVQETKQVVEVKQNRDNLRSVHVPWQAAAQISMPKRKVLQSTVNSQQAKHISTRNSAHHEPPKPKDTKSLSRYQSQISKIIRHTELQRQVGRSQKSEIEFKLTQTSKQIEQLNEASELEATMDEIRPSVIMVKQQMEQRKPACSYRLGQSMRSESKFRQFRHVKML